LSKVICLGASFPVRSPLHSTNLHPSDVGVPVIVTISPSEYIPPAAFSTIVIPSVGETVVVILYVGLFSVPQDSKNSPMNRV
jgi:hypothetical protein